MTLHVEPGSYSSISMALIKLGCRGGTIIVEAGEYNINSSDDVAFLPSNITIRGKGASTIIKVNTTWHSAFQHIEPIKHVNISDLQLRITTPRENTYTGNLINLFGVEDVNLENLHITTVNSQIGSKGEVKVTNAGISITGGKGVNIERCTAEGMFIAIYLQDCTRSSVYRNDNVHCFCNCFINDSANIDISKNFFTNSLYTGPFGIHSFMEGSDGVLAMNSKYLTISGNHLIDNSEHGLYLSGCVGCAVNGNIIHGNGEQGFQIRYSGTPPDQGWDLGHTITGNVITGNGKRYPKDLYHGIGIYDYAQNLTIVGNTICNNGALGVRALGKGSDKLTLVGNTITGNGEKAQVSVEPEYLKFVNAHNLISEYANAPEF